MSLRHSSVQPAVSKEPVPGWRRSKAVARGLNACVFVPRASGEDGALARLPRLNGIPTVPSRLGARPLQLAHGSGCVPPPSIPGPK